MNLLTCFLQGLVFASSSGLSCMFAQSPDFDGEEDFDTFPGADPISVGVFTEDSSLVWTGGL